MNQIEELCDRILMMNKGRSVLYGGLAEIKSRYKNNSVLLYFEGELGEVPGVAEKRVRKHHVELFLDDKTSPQQLLARLLERVIIINRFEIATPPLNEIFIKIVGKNSE